MAPGRVVEWRLRSTAAAAADTDGAGDAAGRRASFNQDKHFTVAEESRGADDPVASWIAVTFEVAGVLDEQALTRALLAFVRRHEVLRCEFRRLAGELACEPIAACELALDTVPVAAFDSSEALRGFLVDRFKRSIDTLSWPLFTMGAVLREDSATVYLAFDHIVCDGLSMPIVVHEVQSAYEALRRGEDIDLPAAPSYLDFAEEQRRRYLSIDADDERLGYWKSFMARGEGEFFPRFPLELGVEPDRMYPIVNEASPLLDAAEAEVFEKACRAVGGKPFMGCSRPSRSVCARPAGPACTGGSCRSASAAGPAGRTRWGGSSTPCRSSSTHRPGGTSPRSWRRSGPVSAR